MEKLAFILSILLLTGGAFADISISEPNNIYNLGDRLYVDLGGLRGENNGNLDINLNCGNSSINMVRLPARSFSGEEDQTYSIPYKILDWDDLGVSNLDDIVGTCQIVASLGKNVASGKTFEITNDVIVSTSLNGSVYNPGDSVDITIHAVKPNGAKLNGFVEGSNASSFNEEISDGIVSTSFKIIDSAEAGVYSLNLLAYDVGVNGVLNSGNYAVSYVVNQVATSLVLSLSDNVATPGENFSIGLNVFDQSGVEMNGAVSVKIISSDGSEIDNVVQAGDFVFIDFDSNSSVGTWKIVAQFDDLIQEREFEMGALQKVEFDFEDSVLVVKNIGNVLYNRTIDVNIGKEIMKLKLKIDVGDIRKFSLKAPMGSYDVIVDDGENQINHEVLLTGNAISVSDFNGAGVFWNYSALWIFLIIVLAITGGILIIKFRKTRTLGEDKNFFRKIFGRVKTGSGKAKKKVSEKVPKGVKSYMDNSLNFTKKSPAVQGLDVKNYSHEDKTMVDFTKKESMGAEASLVLKGEKQTSGIVAISIKNHGEMGDAGKDALEKIIVSSKNKGLVDWRGDYVFVVFNPLITKTYKNEGLAVRCAIEIIGKIKNYNKKFRDKIEFGVGVHSGDLIASKDKGKLKYTSIGNTISFAKRMSDVDSSQVVISDTVRKKLLREVKVKKGKEIGENLTYIVSELRDRSEDAAKLKELLKRSSG